MIAARSRRPLDGPPFRVVLRPTRPAFFACTDTVSAEIPPEDDALEPRRGSNCATFPSPSFHNSLASLGLRH